MLFKYGVRLQPSLVKDPQGAPIPITSKADQKFESRHHYMVWPYFPVAFGSSKHSITKGIEAVRFQFANPIDTLWAKDIKKTVLLSSSSQSRLEAPMNQISLDIQVDKSQANKGAHILAVLLEGSFSSAYKNRIASSKMKSFKEKSDQIR